MKINKLLSLAVSAFLIFNASAVFAAAKRDVTDPVLREMINEFSKKMPKFIDKYGETVFVADEPVTRGSLLSAFYEYDKRLKTSPLDVSATVSKQDFDALKNKVTLLEKSSSTAQGKASGGSIDTVKLISELEPNMPTLLDNSLKNSKVFRELQSQVSTGGGRGTGTGGSGNYASINKEIVDLNERVDMLSKKLDSNAGVSSEEKSSSMSGATIATISLGITMIAALFVAR